MANQRFRAATVYVSGTKIAEIAQSTYEHMSGDQNQIGLDGVQLLGGHGFTKEHPVERWYRDLRGAGIGEGIVVL